MAASKKKRSPRKTYRFQLTLTGILGIGVVCFCLFMWMFLLGIWAGQTILLPAAKPQAAGSGVRETASRGAGTAIEMLDAGAKKKPVENEQTK
ncbi:MAG: hypothetical protein RBR09_08260 [Desulfobulbaceae bacterium]|jgi:hypothetical protein|nr:hypothetical protein [Desulfobulbaceae bacterium]MDY0351232.1 hypothetical protein [Desulfobulbaceae bacterium]